MCGLHLPSNLVVALLRGLPYQLALPHELVPVDSARSTLAAFAARFVCTLLIAATFVNHRSPRFLISFALLLPLGLPPSFPHSRIRRTNSFLPHSFCRTFALFRPRRLAAFLTFVMRRYNKPNYGL